MARAPPSALSTSLVGARDANHPRDSGCIATVITPPSASWGGAGGSRLKMVMDRQEVICTVKRRLRRSALQRYHAHDKMRPVVRLAREGRTTRATAATSPRLSPPRQPPGGGGDGQVRPGLYSEAPLTGERLTGVTHLQENAPPKDPSVGLCLGS